MSMLFLFNFYYNYRSMLDGVVCCFIHRLRKVKMDQRKLMDNANTITDMAKVMQNKHKLQRNEQNLSTHECDLRANQ